VIGGNLFEVLFLAAADFFHRPGSIYQEFDVDNVFIAVLAILMTGVLLLGMLRRQRTASPASASRARRSCCSPWARRCCCSSESMRTHPRPLR
jgi:hypothetical protein